MAPPRWLVAASLSLSIAGLAISGYLTVEHYTASTTLACPDTGVVNCQKVTSSPEATILGIPVAVLGLVYFVLVTAACLPAAWRSHSLYRGRLALAATGAAFVIYLIYVELFVLDAICLWCTAVHVIAVALFAVIAVGAALDDG